MSILPSPSGPPPPRFQVALNSSERQAEAYECIWTTEFTQSASTHASRTPCAPVCVAWGLRKGEKKKVAKGSEKTGRVSFEITPLAVTATAHGIEQETHRTGFLGSINARCWREVKRSLNRLPSGLSPRKLSLSSSPSCTSTSPPGPTTFFPTLTPASPARIFLSRASARAAMTWVRSEEALSMFFRIDGSWRNVWLSCFDWTSRSRLAS